MKFTFTCVVADMHDPTKIQSVISKSTNVLVLGDLVGEFKEFLLGCGYSPEGVKEAFGEYTESDLLVDKYLDSEVGDE